MPGPIQTITLVGRRIYNSLFPSQGPAEISVSVDFSYQASQGLHLTAAMKGGELDFIQTVWADNRASSQALLVTCDTNEHTIVWPAGSIGYQPFLANSPKITVSCADNTQTATKIKFINVPISALMTYSAASGGSTPVVGLLGNNSDAVAPVTAGNVGSDSYLYGFDNANGAWSRVRLNPNNAGTPLGAANTTDSLVVTSITAGNTAGNAQPVGAVFPADIVTAVVSLASQAFNSLFNGATWDRQRGNIDTTALISLSATAAGTVNSADQTNYNGRGVKIVLNITATTGTNLITVQGKDAASGAYYNIGASIANAGTGTFVLTVYPNGVAAANVYISDIIPRTWRVQVTVGAGGGSTGTVGASVML